MRKLNKKSLVIISSLVITLISTLIFIVYAATGDIMPSDGAVITSAQITSMVTGTAPFDTSSRSGRDMSPDDDIVRSFDQVTYTIESTMAINTSDGSANYKGGSIYIEATIPQDCTWEEWDISSMAWGEVVSLSDDKKHVILKYDMDNTKVTVPGKQELSMIMKVGGEKNDTKVTPTFKVWLEGNDTDPQSAGYEAKDIIPQTVTVTSKPKYNVRLKKNSELNHIVTLDIDGVPTKGRMYGFITTLQLKNDSSSRALKGIEYPTGDITYDVDVVLRRYDGNGNLVPGIEDKVIPILYNYSVNYVDKNGVIPDKPLNIASDKTASGRLVAPRGSRDKYDIAEEKRIGDSIYNSGSFTCTQQGNTLHITNSGYEFDGYFPVRNSEYDGLPINYDPDEGCFAAGYFEVFVPFTEDTVDSSYTYSLEFNDYNFKATSLSGNEVTEQRKSSDDKDNIQFFQRKAGSFWYLVNIRDVNEEYVHSEYDQGDAYGFKTQNLWLVSRFDNSSSNDADVVINSMEHLLKFDDKCYTPIKDINGKESFTKNRATSDLSYKIYYAAKPDGTGWSSDQEMEDAKRKDLIYYETLEELKANNKICVAFLAESQSGSMSPSGRSDVYFPVKVKNTVVPGQVYQIINDYEVYYDALDRTKYNATSGVTYPLADYKNGDTHYTKTAYDENGIKVPGTHNRGNEIGTSLLIIEADTNVTIEPSQINSAGGTKINYDFDKNEYEVDYKLSPYIIVPDTVNPNNLNYTQDVLARAYLPSNQMSYLPGSCDFGDPTIYKKTGEDGIEYTVLEWKIVDCKLNEPLAPINFKGVINPKLNNNEQIIVKATTAIQDGDEIRPELKEHRTTVQVINLSSHRLYKEVEKSLVNKDEKIHFIVTYINNSDKDVPDFQLLDILPYNGDSRGSSFDGNYKVESINITQTQGDNEVPIDNLKLYLSNSESSRNIDSKNTDIGVSADWILKDSGIINDYATAYALKGNAIPGSKVVIDIVLQPEGNVGGNIYYNNASAQTSLDTVELVSTNTFASVISRKIEGIVWYDKNANGIMDSDETKLPNVNVSITNVDGTQVYDVLGNPISNKLTDENGYYCFERLAQGNYNIKVEMPSGYVSFTEKFAGKNPKYNSVVDENGQIQNIEVVNNEATFNLVISNQNAGLIKQTGKVKVYHVLEGTDISDPENITEELYPNNIYKGEIGESYTTVDRLREINLSHDEEYKLIGVEGITSGNFKEEIQYVIYIYNIKLDVPNFDLSLRKYITGINGTALTDRIPKIKQNQIEQSKIGYKKSAFSWNESNVNDPTDMISICNLLGIDEIYQSILTEDLRNNPQVVAEFVKRVKSESNYNTKITYLRGTADWYAKPSSIKKRMDYLVTYNSNVDEEAKIDSIALDIEPWTLGLTEDYSTTYKNTMSEIFAYSKEIGIKVVVVIPFWLDTADSVQDKELYTTIIQGADEVVVMNYNKKASIKSAMDNEIQAAIDNGKTIYSAAELQDPITHNLEETITYYNDGLDVLHSDWKKLQDKWPEYDQLSFSYHNIEALKKLLNKDKVNGNFEYNHPKNAIKVEPGDLVEFTISVYNEGEVEGEIQSIVDMLPEGLEFVSIDENYTCDESEDKRTLIIHPKTATYIPAYNGAKLSQVDIKVTCRVTKKKSSKEQVLTNIAYINEQNCYSNGMIVPDGDSSVNRHPLHSNDYIGNVNNKTELNDPNYYYKGQEDDDDFEKVYLEADPFHIITTEVDGVGGIISGQNEEPYEEVVHGENSIKDIIATPEENYKVTSITINGQEVEFTAKDDGTVELPKFENMTEDKHIIVKFEIIKGKITITKVDKKDNTKLLSGATYQIEQYDDSGNVIDTSKQQKTTDTNGKVEFTDLVVGKYKITEIKAPEGYSLTKDSLNVEITRNNAELNIIATDNLKLELPITGKNSHVLHFIVAGIVIMMCAIALGKKQKTKITR